MKRKTIDDFFFRREVVVADDSKAPSEEKQQQQSQQPIPSTIKKVKSTSDHHHHHHHQEGGGVPGLEIRPDFVTPEEERHLLSFLDGETWRTDLSRRVIHYGGTYCLMTKDQWQRKPPRNASTRDDKNKSDNFTARSSSSDSSIITAPPIPPTLNFLVDRMCDPSRDIFNLNLNLNLNTTTKRPEFCIVNEYRGTQGISAHVENFRFAAPVCGLTLANGDWIRFHELTCPNDGSVRSGNAAKAERTGRRRDVWLPRRSLMVMKGDARCKWQHEIVRGRRKRCGGENEGESEWRRVSLTFRAERASFGTTTGTTSATK